MSHEGGLVVYVHRGDATPVGVELCPDATVGDLLAEVGGGDGELRHGGVELRDPSALLSDVGIGSEAHVDIAETTLASPRWAPRPLVVLSDEARAMEFSGGTDTVWCFSEHPVGHGKGYFNFTQHLQADEVSVGLASSDQPAGSDTHGGYGGVQCAWLYYGGRGARSTEYEPSQVREGEDMRTMDAGWRGEEGWGPCARVSYCHSAKRERQRAAPPYGSGDIVGLWVDTMAGEAQFYLNGKAQGGVARIPVGAPLWFVATLDVPGDRVSVARAPRPK